LERSSLREKNGIMNILLIKGDPMAFEKNLEKAKEKAKS